MKKIYTLTLALFLCTFFVKAQGIYQMWGLTGDGGIYDNCCGGGVIFSLNSDGNNYQPRHFFTPSTSFGPQKLNLFPYNGLLYGTTVGGGNSGAGLLFEWNISSNTYTKKIDLVPLSGRNPIGGLALYAGKFYGMTKNGGANGYGVIFEWDPSTNIYTKKTDLSVLNGGYPEGDLVLSNNKFYGLTTEGGVNNLGVVFEWDPLSNNYTKKIDLSSLNGSEPHGSLILNGGKLYGMTSRGGTNNKGVIFEWDPSTNIYIRKHNFNDADGAFPYNSLTIKDAVSFYGLTTYGGQNGTGVIFEWNSGTNLFTKKIDLGTGIGVGPRGNLIYSNGKYFATALYGGTHDSGTVFQWDPITNIASNKVNFNGYLGPVFAKSPYSTFTNVKAPVAPGIINSCTSFASVTIDNSNNNVWVPITDNRGDALAEIKANGNNLGVVNTSMYINSGPVREDASHKLYLDRNLTITPTVQPSTAVDVRLYLKGSEFLALKNATNSLGQPSGINTINDVGFFKNSDGCLPALQNSVSPVAVTGEFWNDDYVVTASITGFSSFYAAKVNAPVPLSLLDFNVRLINGNNDAELTWKTTNEINTHSFEIERSIDGRQFKNIGVVLSYNTPGDHQYSFEDKGIASLNSPKIIYRLKQIDSDGKYIYSHNEILNSGLNKNIIITPNPATETVTLSFSNTVPLHSFALILDMQGKEVKKFTINNYREQVDISTLSKGTYIIKIADGTMGRFVKK